MSKLHIKTCYRFSIATAVFLFLTSAPTAFANECMIGEIRMFAGNFAPRNWAFTDGQLLSINENNALFAILGTTYGGDGRTTFALPDLRGRVSVHEGTGPGLSAIRLGEKGGTQQITLNQNNMPAHDHTATTTLRASDGAADTTSAEGNALATSSRNTYLNAEPTKDMKPGSALTTISSSGAGQAINIRNPYLGVNYIICLQGIFPSRN